MSRCKRGGVHEFVRNDARAGRLPTCMDNQSAAQRIVRAVFAGGLIFAVVTLLPLVLLAGSYHGVRSTATAFDAAPHCHDANPPLGPSAGPGCITEWANVTSRYFKHPSSRSSYHYYLDLRGAYGDRSTAELINVDIFWRVRNGDALMLTLWQGRSVEVRLVSGERSQTAKNPDFELSNVVHAITMMAVMEMIALGVVFGAAFVRSQLAPQV